MEIIWKNNKKDKTYNAYRLLGTGGKSSDGPWIEEVEIYSDFKYTPENGKLLTVQDLQTLEATIFKSSHIRQLLQRRERNKSSEFNRW